MAHLFSPADREHMRQALTLARRGWGRTSPNPMVGAVLVRGRQVLGSGWHHKAGAPHAEIEALRAAQTAGHKIQGATLYVTLEPCCTHGRTPPCTDAIITAGVKRVLVAAVDPNPAHRGKGLELLRKAGIRVEEGLLAEEATELNEAFNHWIVQRTPWVTLKAGSTLDGKIATASGESKWITGPQARAYGQRLRRAADAILVGVNTILRDDPALTVRDARGKPRPGRLRRLVLDSRARTPLESQVVSDPFALLTTIVTTPLAPSPRVDALAARVSVLVAPVAGGHVDLNWLLKKLGEQQVTHLLVEGGGEVNARFLLGGLVHRVVFFYAPKVIGDRDAIRAVGGKGVRSVPEGLRLSQTQWRMFGDDLCLSALVQR